MKLYFLCMMGVSGWVRDILGRAEKGRWCRRTDSNRGPEVYKTPALPTELRRLLFTSQRVRPGTAISLDKEPKYSNERREAGGLKKHPGLR